MSSAFVSHPTKAAGHVRHPRSRVEAPVDQLTVNLAEFYKHLNEDFKFSPHTNPRRVLSDPSTAAGNNGWDNHKNDLIMRVGDVLTSDQNEAKRYTVLDMLGSGTFGQVVKCQNVSTKEIVAVKVIKNQTAYFRQALEEIRLLKMLNTEFDPDGSKHVVRLNAYFTFRQHLCLVFELLDMNLYELIKQNGFGGLSMFLVRSFLHRILETLVTLRTARVIHCDLKPENILLRSLNSPEIRVIDFGSACLEQHTVYSYIQSRFYRSPEVLLGIPYTLSIDMWSFGCIAAELFLGLPLFPGKDEYDQIRRIMDSVGMFPLSLLSLGKKVKKYFITEAGAEPGSLRYRLKTRHEYYGKNTRPPSRPYFDTADLSKLIMKYQVRPEIATDAAKHRQEMTARTIFLHFLLGILQPDPRKRWTPRQASCHPFITGQGFTGEWIPPPDPDSPPVSARPFKSTTPSPRRPPSKRTHLSSSPMSASPSSVKSASSSSMESVGLTTSQPHAASRTHGQYLQSPSESFPHPYPPGASMNGNAARKAAHAHRSRSLSHGLVFQPPQSHVAMQFSTSTAAASDVAVACYPYAGVLPVSSQGTHFAVPVNTGRHPTHGNARGRSMSYTHPYQQPVSHHSDAASQRQQPQQQQHVIVNAYPTHLLGAHPYQHAALLVTPPKYTRSIRPRSFTYSSGTGIVNSAQVSPSRSLRPVHTRSPMSASPSHLAPNRPRPVLPLAGQSYATAARSSTNSTNHLQPLSSSSASVEGTPEWEPAFSAETPPVFTLDGVGAAAHSQSLTPMVDSRSSSRNSLTCPPPAASSHVVSNAIPIAASRMPPFSVMAPTAPFMGILPPATSVHRFTPPSRNWDTYHHSPHTSGYIPPTVGPLTAYATGLTPTRSAHFASPRSRRSSYGPGPRAMPLNIGSPMATQNHLQQSPTTSTASIPSPWHSPSSSLQSLPHPSLYPSLQLDNGVMFHPPRQFPQSQNPHLPLTLSQLPVDNRNQ